MTDYLANLPELIVSAVTKLFIMINLLDFRSKAWWNILMKHHVDPYRNSNEAERTN